MSVGKKSLLEWLTQRFELSRGGGGHNVRPMEGLRGFAVFLVFLVHYVTLVDPWIGKGSAVHSVAAALHTIGNTGVDLFFVLSGYLIYGSLISRRQSFLRYMWRRVERIYPAFLVVFAIYVGLSFAFPAENKIPASFVAAASYLAQNLLLLPGLFPIEPLITVAWSLSYELFYYLAIPFVIAAFGLRRRSARWRVVFFSSVVVATTVYCAAFGGHLRLIMFVAGILLHEALGSERLPAPGSLAAALALAAGLLFTLVPVAGSAAYAAKVSVLFIAFFVTCHSCFVHSHEWLPRAFSWTPLRWLGNISYSYYLIHGLALKACFIVLAVLLPTSERGALFFCSVLPLMFALTLIPASMLFLAIERPFSLTPRRARSASESPRKEEPAAVIETSPPQGAQRLL